MSEEKEELKITTRRIRKFLGKISDFTDKTERKFEKAHLKAYLKGRRTFYHGFTTELSRRVRVIHLVKQDLYNI